MIPENCVYILNDYRTRVLEEAADHPLYLQILQAFNQTYAAELVKASEGKSGTLGIPPSNMAALVTLRLLGFPVNKLKEGVGWDYKVYIQENGRCICGIIE